MLTSQQAPRISTLFKTLLVCFVIFFSSVTHAGNYGGHHYGHGYGHNVYRNYHHSYNYHHGYYGHYGIHARVGDTAGYVILGILGVAVLSHIFNNNSREQHQYRNTYSNNQILQNTPLTYPDKIIVQKKILTKPDYSYGINEGWDWLAKDNPAYALDIFAVQSQQNLNSGIPKIGFAIAAATKGESERAARAMRKAIRIDADALNMINTNSIKSNLEKLSETYKAGLANNNDDDAFMIAVISYLQQDYEIAYNSIAKNDYSQSAIKLRELIKGFI